MDRLASWFVAGCIFFLGLAILIAAGDVVPGIDRAIRFVIGGALCVVSFVIASIR